MEFLKGVAHMSFSPDGHYLFVGNQDSTFSIWETLTWTRYVLLIFFFFFFTFYELSFSSERCGDFQAKNQSQLLVDGDVTANTSLLPSGSPLFFFF